MVLFIMMPFAGAYVGYRLAPERLVEVSILQDVVSDYRSDVPITYLGFYGDQIPSGFSLRNKVLFYGEKNLEVSPVTNPLGLMKGLVFVDNQLWHKDLVLEKTKSVQQIVSDVFLTDTAIYQGYVNDNGEPVIKKSFSDVDVSTFVPVQEFTDGSTSTYLRPVADGDYANRWFSDSSSFYCVKESPVKLMMPVGVLFHPLPKNEYPGSPEEDHSIRYLLWNQVNNKNILGSVSFIEASSGKEYDIDCKEIK
jgi:hypothetical protein